MKILSGFQSYMVESPWKHLKISGIVALCSLLEQESCHSVS